METPSSPQQPPEVVEKLRLFCHRVCRALEEHANHRGDEGLIKTLIEAHASTIFGSPGLPFDNTAMTISNLGMSCFSVDFYYHGQTFFCDFNRGDKVTYFLDGGDDLVLCSRDDLRHAQAILYRDLFTLAEMSAYKKDKLSVIKDTAMSMGFSFLDPLQTVLVKWLDGVAYYDVSAVLDLSHNYVKLHIKPIPGSTWRDGSDVAIAIEKRNFTRSTLLSRLRRLGIDAVKLEQTDIDLAVMKQFEALDISLFEIAEVF